MDRWTGKVALVTGASSGIGAAIVIDLVKAGMIVVGAARRVNRVEELKDQISSAQRKNLHPFKCDVSKEEDIKSAFKFIEEKFGGVDVLINNAGITKPMNIVDADNTAQLREVIDTNLVAAALCCREAFQSMKKRSVDGHIVLINSIVGHYLPFFVNTFPSFNIYPSTKYALTAMTEVLRQEFQLLQTKVKITSISPGLVNTEIIPDEFKAHLGNVGVLESKDISDAVLYVLGTPPHVQVHELTIKPVGEKF